MTVLVAHPDAALRHEARLLLESLGHRVVDATDADGAMALCRAERPDVVLVREGLRRPDGSALLTAIKRDVDLFRTAVVPIRTAGGLEGVIEALRDGAHDVLREPVDPGELVARVASAARTKTLQEELTMQSARVEGLVYGDDLTGQFNRRFLLAQLSALVSGARRHGRPLSVAMIDIDHFKAVNDVHGHAAGDAVLVEVARVLRERLRGEDWFGRLGGEEFLALLPDDDAAGAAVVAEALRKAVEQAEIRIEDLVLPVTASVGWATLEPGEDPDTLLRRADGALYAAKRAGRNATRGAATLRRRT